jgi:hypothetical protein
MAIEWNLHRGLAAGVKNLSKSCVCQIRVAEDGHHTGLQLIILPTPLRSAAVCAAGAGGLIGMAADSQAAATQMVLSWHICALLHNISYLGCPTSRCHRVHQLVLQDPF